MEREVTKFRGLDIIHPHSGKISRSVIGTRLKNYFGTAEYVPNHGTVWFEDVNNAIRLDYFCVQSQEDLKYEIEQERKRLGLD